MDECEFDPSEWNQYGIYHIRINNNIEIFNNNVNNQLRTKPNLLRFYDFIREQENKMSIEILNADMKLFYILKQTKEVKLIYFTNI